MAEKFHEGDIITGTVKRLVSFGAFVEVAPGIEGLVHISQIANRHVATADEVLEVGQEVKVKVLGVSEAEQRLSLSIREVEGDSERREVERYTKKNNRNNNNNYNTYDAQEGSGLGTLGDVFGDLFKK